MVQRHVPPAPTGRSAIEARLDEALSRDFATLTDLVALHAEMQPDAAALICGEARVSYGELAETMDRIAGTLAADGLKAGDVVATCAAPSPDYVAAFLGALRLGVAVAPLPTSGAAADLLGMVRDSGARLIFWDASGAERLAAAGIPGVSLDGLAPGRRLPDWITGATSPPPSAIDPDSTFNIIYSSGTTGAPKGIVQPHRMRWAHIQRARWLGYGPGGVTITATQLYSNLTLVSLLPTLALGGTVAMMPQFDAAGFLELAERARATHTFLVPVQYRRLMDEPGFNGADLSSFRLKVCAGAPCAPALKSEILARWPGDLVDLYGMTEGGATCLLFAARHPDKLHTVGPPQAGHEIRILAEDDRPAAPGQMGEVVGRSSSMMTGYHNQPERTLEVEWRDEAGRRFIRTGDIGVIDEDGFLAIVDRKKDMIISGGFNIYPSDIEAVLRQHGDVLEAAVVGVPSERWGETPVAFAVLRDGATDDASQIQAWLNDRLGKTQRVAAVAIADALPRSAIDKVLKRELRDRAIAAGLG